MTMEDDPDKINDPNRQLETKVVQQAEKYQASRLRSQNENKVKADGRKEIDKLGFRTDAYQSALRVARDLTPAEQKQYVRDFRFFLKVFGDKQQELWPEDAAKAAARAKRRAERKAKETAAAGGETPEQQERRLAADLNPRSDPKRGGAGKGRKKAEKPATPAPAGDAKPWPDDTAAALAKAPPSDATHAALESSEAAINAEQEQIAGAEILDHKFGLTGKSGMGSVSDEKPLSQSAQVAAINEKLGLDK